MIVEVEFNITPFKMFLGKVIPSKQTEWFFIENYSIRDLSTVLDKYFYILEKEFIEEPNFEQLFNMLAIFHTAIIRKAPKEYAVLHNAAVTKRYVNDDGKDIIRVKYFFDQDE